MKASLLIYLLLNHFCSADCTFAHFDGSTVVAVSGAFGADASFIGCDFLGNAITTSHSNAVLGAWVGSDGAAAVSLRQTTFHNNQAEHMLLAEDADSAYDSVFFSDRGFTVLTVDDFGSFEVTTSSLSVAAETDVKFLHPGPGSWFSLVNEVLFCCV